MRPPGWLVGTLHWFPATLLAALVLGMLSGLMFIPRLLYPPLSTEGLSGVPDVKTRIALEQAQGALQNDARSTLLQGFAGLILVAGAAATWRQVQISRHGQVTEQFSRAVDQLGSQTLDVRLGGIYALHRVADRAHEDRAPIASILTAFVRTHAPSRDGTRADEQRCMSELTALPWLQIRAADVQAALKVLGNRPVASDEEPLYLAFTDLRKARLADGRWSGADLTDANLAGIRMQRARLDGANLSGSDLRHAHAVGARLLGARLRGVLLNGANLQHADLRGADFTDAHLAGADLTAAQTDERTKWPEGFTPIALPPEPPT